MSSMSLRQLLSEMSDRQDSLSKAGTIGGTQFQDLKELLKKLEAEGCLGDKAPPFEIQERVHTLCRKFLGGSWKDVPIQDLLISRMKGGMSNMLFLCQLPPSYPPRKAEPDKCLLRVYFNPETESHLVAESVIFTLLSERQLGPRLFGIFNGGRLEEFIVSRPLTTEEIRDPIVSRRIGKKLARVHGLSVPIEKDGHYLMDAIQRWLTCLLELVDGKLREMTVKNAKGTLITISGEMLIAEISTIRFLYTVLTQRQGDLSSVPVHGKSFASPPDTPKYSLTVHTPDDDLQSVNAKLAAGRPFDLTMAELEAEAILVKKCISRSHSPVIFCHNDLQEGNILLPKGKKFGAEAEVEGSGEDGSHRKRSGSVYEKDLVLIDFEYASYNYRAFDFANHFLEMTIDYSNEKPPYYWIKPEHFPDEEAQRIFFQAYREGEAEMYGGGEIGGEERVQKLIDETRPFVAVSNFFYGVWSLLQLEVSPIEFGFEEYARARLGMYFAWRGEMMKLLEQDPPPASPIPSRHSSGDRNRPPPPPLTGFSLAPPS